MPAQPPLDSPFEAFAKCPVPLLLIGGNAVIGYGSQRITQDCDCAVVVADEQHVAAVLKPLGYIFHERQGTFARYVHLARLRPVVDVMLLPMDTFEKLWAESCEVTLIGHKLRAPKPLHLVALKLHALKQNPRRTGKDLEDIFYLLEEYRDQWKREDLAELAERYGSEETLDELRRRGFL